MDNSNPKPADTNVFWRRLEYVRTIPRISALKKAILYALVSRMGNKHDCFPSIARLCVDSGGKERAVQIAVKSLAEDGILSVRWKQGPGGTNLYAVVLPDDQSQPNTTVSATSTGAADAPLPQNSLHAGAADAPHKAQQVRPKEHEKLHPKENINQNTCPHVDSNTDFPAPAPAAKQRQRKFLWKDLRDAELAEIVATADVARWKLYDDEWMVAFGSDKSSQRRQLRLAMWRSAYRKATSTNGSMAALLVSAFRTHGDGKAAETFCNCDDAEWARHTLNPPVQLPSRTAQPVQFANPFTDVSNLVPDYI